MSSDIVITEEGDVLLVVEPDPVQIIINDGPNVDLIVPPSEDVDVVVVYQSGPQGPTGPEGPTGSQGPPGPPGGSTYSHHQISPASSWPVSHNQGRYIEPVVFLEGDDTPVEPDLVYPDVNTTVIIFPAPAAGWAYF